MLDKFMEEFYSLPKFNGSEMYNLLEVLHNFA